MDTFRNYINIFFFTKLSKVGLIKKMLAVLLNSKLARLDRDDPF